MIRSVKALRHVAVNALDGRIGFVEQAFFDDEEWVLWYLVVDTGPEFSDRRVLVSPTVVDGFVAEPAAIGIRLSRHQVAGSPDAESEKPVSRLKELEFSRTFQVAAYWGEPGLGLPRMLPAAGAILPPHSPAAPPDSTGVHLRSSREVIGYRVKARDGRVGHIEDLLFDDDTWVIRYLEVDTRNWIGGRHVLVPPQRVHSVSWETRTIALDLAVECVRSAPECRSANDATPDFEQRVRSHFHREHAGGRRARLPSRRA
jgi:hypothetical protein